MSKKAKSATAEKNAGSFKEDFKVAREAAGLTQGEAADLLRVARRAVQQWEGGLREPIYPAQWGALNLLRAQPPRGPAKE